MSQKIYCKCGVLVPAEDVNLDRMVAKCTACDAVFKVDLDGPAVDGLRIPKPDELSVEHTDGTLRFRHRWFEAMLHMPILAFTVAWMAFLIFWYSRVDSLLFMIFPVLHVLAGLGLIWFTARGLLNRTELVVGPRTLTGTSGPIPPRARADYHRDAVVGVFVRENAAKYVRMVPEEKRAQAKALQSYSVWLQLTGDREVRLAAVLRSKPVALFIEQEIEAELGLSAEAVYGAVEVPEGLRRPVPDGRRAGALAIAESDDAKGGLSER